jgi:transposase
MSGTQTATSHLKALHDQLKSAMTKQDDQMKSDIRAASTHVEQANAALKAQLQADNKERRKEAQQAIQQLDTLSQNAGKALSENGTALHDRVRQMVANAKAALDSES